MKLKNIRTVLLQQTLLMKFFQALVCFVRDLLDQPNTFLLKSLKVTSLSVKSNKTYLFISVSSWQLSRTKALPVVSSFAINQIINSIDVLDNRYFFHMDQSDDACFYYPPPGNTLVVFPGQCDLAIPVVANFDVRAVSMN